jgi:hypothetical protein
MTIDWMERDSCPEFNFTSFIRLEVQYSIPARALDYGATSLQPIRLVPQSTNHGQFLNRSSQMLLNVEALLTSHQPLSPGETACLNHD